MTDGDRDNEHEGGGMQPETTAREGDAEHAPRSEFGFDVLLEDGEQALSAESRPHDADLTAAAHEESAPTVVTALPTIVATPGDGSQPHDAHLEERMAKLRKHLRRHSDRVTTEVAAKLSLVAPFLTALGYDVFDPAEVVPDYNHQGGRADFAVCEEEAVRMLVGYVPSVSEVSANHLRRLANGVESSGSACAIVTDGRTADVHGLSPDGTMDERPLVTVRLLEGDEVPLALHAITRDGWNLDAFRILGQTERERHVVREAVLAELQDPTNPFLEAVEARLREAGHHVGDGTRLAIEAQASAIATAAGDRPEPVVSMPSANHSETDEDRRMTPEEEAAFNRIRSICGTHINPSRVVARPGKSYIAVLLDDNNRRSIARIHFKADRTKYIGTFVGQVETRNEVSGASDIQSLNDKIIARVHELDRA